MNKIRNKIVLLGDVYVGKTSLATRFSKNEFKDQIESTSGGVFFTHTIEKDGNRLQFDIWDTAGQERFRALGALYYKTSKAALIVFDLTNPSSLKKAMDWIEELHKNADPNIVMALVGNKVDMTDQRQISSEEAAKFAEENGLYYYECSAKTGENVREMFIEVMEKVPIFEKANFNVIEGNSLVGSMTETGTSGKVRQCCRM